MNQERQLLLSMLYLNCDDDASYFMIASCDGVKVRDLEVKCMAVQNILRWRISAMNGLSELCHVHLYGIVADRGGYD